MSKGTASKGKRGLGRTHIRCPRCGNPSFHKTKKKCAKCGYGKSKRIRWYAWQKKNKSKWKFKKKKRQQRS